MRSLFFCVYEKIYPVTEQTATLFDNKGRNGI